MRNELFSSFPAASQPTALGPSCSIIDMFGESSMNTARRYRIAHLRGQPGPVVVRFICRIRILLRATPRLRPDIKPLVDPLRAPSPGLNIHGVIPC